MERNRYAPAVAVWDFNEHEPYVSQIQTLAVPLYSFSEERSRSAKLRMFRRLVNELSPEVVHSFSFYTNVVAFLSTVGTPIIGIGSVRSDFGLDRCGSGPLLGRLNACLPGTQIFNSFAAARNASNSRSLFVPARRIVVRNGLDLQRFRMTPLLESGMVSLVGVGSLLRVKRWDRLLRAASELKRRGHEFVLRIAGKGPLLHELELQKGELGLNGRVEFIGHADNVPDLLSKSTFLVHTSDVEGCPNAVIEAMACGRAVVGTDSGEIPFLVDDGKTGFVVGRNDDAMLVDRLSKLMSDHHLCVKMGMAGRAKAESQFSVDRLVAETLAAYRVAGWRDT
jgi:glycosyltransferase involved in cell wall biosynthesis